MQLPLGKIPFCGSTWVRYRRRAIGLSSHRPQSSKVIYYCLLLLDAVSMNASGYFTACYFMNSIFSPGGLSFVRMVSGRTAGLRTNSMMVTDKPLWVG